MEIINLYRCIHGIMINQTVMVIVDDKSYIWDIDGILMMGFEGVPSGCTKDTVRYSQQGMQLGGKHKMNTLW